MIRDIRRRLRGEDSGFTLVELLVAVVLMGIVLAVCSSLFVTTLKSTEQSRKMHVASGNASNAVNELRSVIPFATTNARTGATDPDPAILVGRTDRLVLMATIGAATTVEAGGRPTKPVLVEFAVSGGQLQERRWNPTASAATWVFPGTDPTTVTPASTRLLGGTLTTGGPSMFTYFDTVGNPVTPGATGLTAAQRATVAAIGVRISMVPTDSPTAPPVVITTRIPLANLGLREIS